MPRKAAQMSAIALATLSQLVALPANAVIILDSVWEEYGGAEGNEAAGFEIHEAIAMEPQFASIFGLHNGESYLGSGTWIGNDEEHGYILTAAHNFDGSNPDPNAWTYWSRAGTGYEGVEVHIHPGYDPEDDSTSGYDLAIVVLSTPVTDAGKQPMLYAGDSELGQIITITGYGSRGIGSVGEADEFYDFEAETPAAANNIVDEVDGPNGENNLIVDLDSEDGSINTTGEPGPVDALEGILGSGDSGGAAWMETSKGWAIVATNTWGDDAVYGSISGFSRISTQLDWIAEIYPDFRTAK